MRKWCELIDLGHRFVAGKKQSPGPGRKKTRRRTRLIDRVARYWRARLRRGPITGIINTLRRRLRSSKENPLYSDLEGW